MTTSSIGSVGGSAAGDGSPPNRIRRLDGVRIYAIVLFAAQALGLFKIVVVARMLGDEIQGQVVILGMVVSFFTTVLVMNTAWQLVQSDNCNEPEFQSSLQGMAFIRSIITGVTVAVLGHALLGAFDLEELQGPLLVVAFLPFLEGFIHLDAWRGLRSKSFRKLGFIEIVPPIVSLTTALILLIFYRTVWVYVVAGAAGSFAKMVTSHLVADRRFSIRIHRKYVREIIRFTLPLLPAGMFFWINGQSDRIVLFLADGAGQIALLGAYGTVAMLCFLPIAPISKLIRSVVVPRLADVKHDIGQFRSHFLGMYLRVGACIVVVVLGAGIGAGPILELVLGEEFRPGAVVAPILITAASLQLTRGLSYQLGVARGDTRVQLVGNLARLSGIGFAVYSVQSGYGITGLAFSVLLAEIFSLTIVGLFLGWVVAPVTSIIIGGTLVIAGMFLASRLLDLALVDQGLWIRAVSGGAISLFALGMLVRFRSTGIARA